MPRAFIIIERLVINGGTVVCFNDSNVEVSALSSVKILVDAFQFSYIQESIFLFIKGNGFDVYVKEIGKETNSWNSSYNKASTFKLLINIDVIEIR